MWTIEAAAFRLIVLKLQSSLLSGSSCSEGFAFSSRLVFRILVSVAEAAKLSLFPAK